jgi:lipopolysaccharide biosynthesis glycosyltransferase
MGTLNQIFIGFDPLAAAAFAVTRNSARANLTQQLPISGIVLEHLQDCGLYTRPTKITISNDGRRQLIDVLSSRSDYDGRISTPHAIARFLVPHLASTGWALFMDGDMLVRGNLARIFDRLDRTYAVYCVKHNHEPPTNTKMGGFQQTRYSHKNWSSVMIFNVGHEANKRLTLEAVNTLAGRDLHRFAWLKDEEIGELDPKWNWLAGYSDPKINPEIVHFTDGVPDMRGYEHQPYADEWREALVRWAGNYSAVKVIDRAYA